MGDSSKCLTVLICDSSMICFSFSYSLTYLTNSIFENSVIPSVCVFFIDLFNSLIFDSFVCVCVCVCVCACVHVHACLWCVQINSLK